MKNISKFLTITSSDFFEILLLKKVAENVFKIK